MKKLRALLILIASCFSISAYSEGNGCVYDCGYTPSPTPPGKYHLEILGVRADRARDILEIDMEFWVGDVEDFDIELLGCDNSTPKVCTAKMHNLTMGNLSFTRRTMKFGLSDWIYKRDPAYSRGSILLVIGNNGKGVSVKLP